MAKREFRLGQGIMIGVGQTNYPEKSLYYDNSPIQIVGRCVGFALKIPENENGEPEQINIYMSKEQAKGALKAIKQAMRGLK